MKFRKAILAISIATLALTTACNSKDESLPTIKSFLPTQEDAIQIVDMIDSVELADMTTEDEIEQIYLAYCNLDEDAKGFVTNYEKLVEYRNQITQLYHTEDKQDSRMDRSKINIGTYCFNPQCWNDEGVQALAACGIDFIANASYNEELLSLLDKYEVGAFVSGAVPGWYTGGTDIGNVGMASTYNPISSYESALATFVDRDCIWGIDIGDEPWIEDLPHFGDVIDYLHEKVPGKVIYLNLLPIFNELPTPKLLENYVNYVDTDYICYDNYTYNNYMHDKNNNRKGFMTTLLSNLQYAANICRESNRDLWIVVQSSVLGDTPLKEDHLRSIASATLIFGTRTFSWACWTAGWYENHIADSQGNLTETYYELQKVNNETHNLSPIYSRYKSIDAGYITINPELIGTPNVPNIKKLDVDSLKNCPIQTITATSNSQIIAGYFEKREGAGSAVMFANLTDIIGEETPPAFIEFTVKNPESKVLAYYNGEAYEPEHLGNGQYRIKIENSDNIFVTID